MADDVLTQARTPTEAETEAGQAASAFADGHWEKAATRAVLQLAAPRILALAYWEAAALARTQAAEAEAWIRQQSGFYVQVEDGGMTAMRVSSLRRFACDLEALATALEEGQ